jgi:hypothetical protein
MTADLAEVRQIAGLRDPVIRNLRITECYARLAAGVQSGGANWCTFATWASKQAGQTIRKEGGTISDMRENGMKTVLTFHRGEPAPIPERLLEEAGSGPSG